MLLPSPAERRKKESPLSIFPCKARTSSNPLKAFCFIRCLIDLDKDEKEGRDILLRVWCTCKEDIFCIILIQLSQGFSNPLCFPFRNCCVFLMCNVSMPAPCGNPLQKLPVDPDRIYSVSTLLPAFAPQHSSWSVLLCVKMSDRNLESLPEQTGNFPDADVR